MDENSYITRVKAMSRRFAQIAHDLKEEGENAEDVSNALINLALDELSRTDDLDRLILKIHTARQVLDGIEAEANARVRQGALH